MDSRNIVSRCPSCGGCFLFIGKDGHLTCSVIGCKEPVVDRAVNNLKEDVERLQASHDEIHCNLSNAVMEKNDALNEVERLRLKVVDYEQAALSQKGCADKLEAEVKRLKAENEQQKKLLRGLHRCLIHKPDGSTAWGCPDCVSELRNENKGLREALGPMRQLLVSLKENGSSHAFFIMQQAWGDLDWDEVVKIENSLLEVLKDSK